MNNPNPFVPQGSLLEQQSKRRSRMKLAVLCVLVVGTAGLIAMLIQGCKREQVSEENQPAGGHQHGGHGHESAADGGLQSAGRPAAGRGGSRPWRKPGPNMSSSTATRSGKSRRRIGVTLSALKAANPGVEPTKLKVGQKLTIPAGGTAPAAAGASAATDTGMGGETYT